MTTPKLRAFVLSKLREENLTIRQFAKKIGVSHSTIVRILDETLKYKPDLKTLRQIAHGTHVDVFTIIAMVTTEDIDVESRLIAQKIATLNEQERTLLRIFLNGLNINLFNPSTKAQE